MLVEESQLRQTIVAGYVLADEPGTVKFLEVETGREYLSLVALDSSSISNLGVNEEFILAVSAEENCVSVFKTVEFREYIFVVRIDFE